MRKLNLIVILLACFSVASMTTGCAGGKNYESTGEYFDDSVLTTKVKSAIIADPKLKSLQISVETFKGVVQLSGFVNTQEAANRAVELARKIKGVKQVNNSLIVK